MNSRSGFQQPKTSKKVASNPTGKRPAIITAEQASVLRKLQREIAAEGHDYVREAEEFRHKAKWKRLCARHLRENGYTAEAKQFEDEAKWYAAAAPRVGELDRAITRDLSAFDKSVKAREARINREIDKAVKAGKLTRSGKGRHIAADELIGLPERARSAPAS
jgi:hypothetical protein